MDNTPEGVNASAHYCFNAIGTHWQIDTQYELDRDTRAALAKKIEDYDRSFSRFRSDSLLSRAGQQPGHYQLPAPATQLEPLYRSLYRLSNGAMTPLVTEALEHLGYDAQYTLKAASGFLAAPTWDEAIIWRGTSLHTRQPVVLDFGAAGKGQLVDLLAEVLLAAGLTSFVIDASGDLFSSHHSALKVALEHPYDPSSAIGIVELGGHAGSGYRAICASAANRRSWGDGLHHVLDGTTGRPVRTVVASWAMAANTMQADALATALFFVDHPTLSQEFDYAGVRLFSSGHAEVSENFNGELFYASEGQ